MAHKHTGTRYCERCKKPMYGREKQWHPHCLTPKQKRHRELIKQWKINNPGM